VVVVVVSGVVSRFHLLKDNKQNAQLLG